MNAIQTFPLRGKSIRARLPARDSPAGTVSRYLHLSFMRSQLAATVCMWFNPAPTKFKKEIFAVRYPSLTEASSAEGPTSPKITRYSEINEKKLQENCVVRCYVDRF